MSFFITILGYLWFSYFDLYLVPLHIYSLIATSLILFLLILINGKFKKNFSYFPLAIIGMLWILSTISAFFSKGFFHTGDLIFQAKTLFIPALIYILTSVWLGLSDGNFNFLSKIIIILVLISALTAIGQGIGIEWLWELREKIYFDSISSIADQITTRERPCGLAYFAITLSYQIIAALGLSFVYFLKGRNKLLWIFILSILLTGIAVGLTRSAFLGIMLAFIYYVYRTGIKKILIGGLLVLLILAISWQFIPELYREDASGYGKFALQWVGVNTLINHPLGTGTENYLEVAGPYFYLVDGWKGEGQVETHMSHNQFINSGLYYGISGLLLVIFFYIYYWKEVGLIRKDCWAESMGFRMFIIAYIINSLFHNAGLFAGDPFTWFIISLMAHKIYKCKNYGKLAKS